VSPLLRVRVLDREVIAGILSYSVCGCHFPRSGKWPRWTRRMSWSGMSTSSNLFTSTSPSAPIEMMNW